MSVSEPGRPPDDEAGLREQAWNDVRLSARDRGIVAVSALLAGYRRDELQRHLELALAHGWTKDELATLIDHLAVYVGDTSANIAAAMLEKMLRKS